MFSPMPFTKLRHNHTKKKIYKDLKMELTSAQTIVCIVAT